jgi:hypothetical protein
MNSFQVIQNSTNTYKNMKRSVLVLGTNQEKYLNFALNCAQSVKLHNPYLPIFVATNVKHDKQYDGITFIHVEEDIAKLNIEAKLYLDTFLQTEETLYIDSDSLCYGNLDPIFEACNSMDVTVLGKLVPLDDYWGAEADFARSEFGIDQSILFNGGLYYLKKSTLTTNIYNKGREISKKYDEYGFARIQNDWKNEEELVSIGMISHKQLPIDDGGIFVAGISAYRRPKILNVLKGIIHFSDEEWDDQKTDRRHLLLHFGGENISSYPYISQVTLLKLHEKGYSVALATFLVNIIYFPYQFYYFSKQIYKKLFRKNAF